MEVLRVSANSSPNSVAGAIASIMRDCGEVELQAVGAGATNQAVKAIAVACGYLLPVGIELVCVPTFATVSINGQDRTAIRFICMDMAGGFAVSGEKPPQL
ncbi:MAG: stage V sporulation protein S [Ruminococcus sp.]|nr:stage V sporulation protein S [Ruminococcus sp.]